MFDSSVYKARRKALVEKLHSQGKRSGLALFLGNNEAPMNYTDNTYRFRQDSSFLYFYGLQEAGFAAVLDLESGKSTVFGEGVSVDSMIWTGPRPGLRELGDMAGAEAVAGRTQLADKIKNTELLYLPPYRHDTMIELSALTGKSVHELLAAVAPGFGASMELIRAVIALREIKEEREVREIEEAVNTSVEMHLAVIRAARPGLREAELMSIAYQVALGGGGMPAFPPIATTKGAVLHNHGYERTLEDGGLFLLDSGAENTKGYSGDLTSTFPVSRTYSQQQRTVYEIVLQAGQAGSALLKPGAEFRAAHFAAARAIAGGLRELGIMQGDIDAAIAAGAHALFFPHGLGHQMGLDVHDCEALGELYVGYAPGDEKSSQFGLKSLRMAKALEPGMVLTVEPGIYFIPGLIEIWKKEQRFTEYINYSELEGWLDFGGIRNEEDWLITEDGARRLGKPFDKSVKAMEEYRQKS